MAESGPNAHLAQQVVVEHGGADNVDARARHSRESRRLRAAAAATYHASLELAPVELPPVEQLRLQLCVLVVLLVMRVLEAADALCPIEQRAAAARIDKPSAALPQ